MSFQVERLCPPRKDRPITFALPDAASIRDIVTFPAPVTRLFNMRVGTRNTCFTGAQLRAKASIYHALTLFFARLVRFEQK